jgi:hypothetical protein
MVGGRKPRFLLVVRLAGNEVIVVHGLAEYVRHGSAQGRLRGREQGRSGQEREEHDVEKSTRHGDLHVT